MQQEKNNELILYLIFLSKKENSQSKMKKELLSPFPCCRTLLNARPSMVELILLLAGWGLGNIRSECLNS